MRKIFQFSLIAMLLVSGSALASEAFPVGEDTLYYEIGGGSNIPYSTGSEKHRFPVSASAGMRIGSACSKFDPEISLTNSLNDVESLAKGLGGSMIKSAKAAILNLGPYIIAKGNPTLYNLFNNAFIGGKEVFTTSMKECEQMEQDIQSGKNPYEGIIKIGNQHGWKKEMSIGGDLNKAKETVAKKSKEEGVVWVENKSKGGKGQDPLNLIGDTVKAGYKIMSEQKMFDVGDSNVFNIFSDSDDAKKWITGVVGEYRLVTYDIDKANNEPGFGLTPYLSTKAIEIKGLLQNMVEGIESISSSNIKKISAPGVMINEAVIQNIRVRPSYQQQLIINRLSEESATSITIEKAWQAKKVLQVGLQDPYIAQVDVAQTQVQKSIARIDTEIQEILDALNIKKSLVSNTVNAMFSEQKKTAKKIMSMTSSLDETSVDSANNLIRGE